MALNKKFPFYKQLDYRDCGATCLRMVAKYYGKTFSREFFLPISALVFFLKMQFRFLKTLCVLYLHG
jgi:hypothetical protein